MFSPFPGNVPPMAASLLRQPMPTGFPNFPGFPPLPPLPVPPGGATVDSFDFANIDNGTSALIMPGADMLTDLFVAASPSRRAHVTVECGDQKMEYTLSHKPCAKSVDGNINGQPFTAGMQQIPGATFINGNTPAGPLAETTNYMQGSATSQGVAGNVAYNQTFVNDPTASWTGHAAIWSGTYGPNGGPANQSFGVEITNSPDGNGYLLSGYVGDKPMQGTVKNVAPGCLAIERTIGDKTVRQKIQFG
jgi:hypothetical protein